MFRKANLLVLVLVIFGISANAQKQADFTRTMAWNLGADLSLAAMDNATDTTPTQVNKSFDKAVLTAGKLGIKLPPLPAGSNNPALNNQRLMDYLVTTTRPSIERALTENCGDEHKASFNLSLATNLFYWLYIYGDVQQIEQLAPLLLTIIKANTSIAQLPNETTAEIVNLNDKNSSLGIVKNVVFGTNKKVLMYLINRDTTEIGDRLAAQGKYTEAINLYTKIIEDAPDFAEAYIKRGEAYCEIKDFDSAIADFTKFIAFADKNSYVSQRLQVAFGSRCISYYYKKDFVQAENDCTALININKDYAAAYYFRARARLAQDKTAEAIVDFTKVIETKPFAVTYYYRGVAYQKIGKEDLANLDFEKAESLEPGIIQKISTKKEND